MNVLLKRIYLLILISYVSSSAFANVLEILEEQVALEYEQMIRKAHYQDYSLDKSWQIFSWLKLGGNLGVKVISNKDLHVWQKEHSKACSKALYAPVQTIILSALMSIFSLALIT